MRNQLSRRTVLRGAGVSIALPLLEAMAPVSAQAAAGYGRKKEPLRMAFVYAPNGIHMTDWTPQEEGSGYTKKYPREKILIISDLCQYLIRIT